MVHAQTELQFHSDEKLKKCFEEWLSLKGEDSFGELSMYCARAGKNFFKRGKVFQINLVSDFYEKKSVPVAE